MLDFFVRKLKSILMYKLMPSLLHLVFMRLRDDEIRRLSISTLADLQIKFLLRRELQIELLGRIIKIDGFWAPLCSIYECDSNGQKNGLYIELDSNNTALVIDEYRNNSHHGESRVWMRGGKLKHHAIFRNGKFHGENKEYHHHKGGFDYCDNYHNGLLHGERKVWNENGQLTRHEIWENDKMVTKLL